MRVCFLILLSLTLLEVLLMLSETANAAPLGSGADGKTSAGLFSKIYFVSGSTIRRREMMTSYSK